MKNVQEVDFHSTLCGTEEENTLLDTLTHITVFFFFFIRAHCASMWHFIAAAVAALCVCVRVCILRACI